MTAVQAAEIIQNMIENRYLFDFTEEQLVALRMAVIFLDPNRGHD